MSEVYVKPIVEGWLLVATLVLIALLILVPEFLKSSRLRTVRIGVALLATGSVCMLILKPFYVTKSASGQHILLTKNYSVDVLDSLRKLSPSLKIVSLIQTDKKHEVLNTRSKIKQIDGKLAYVLGDGLSVTELALLNNRNFSFIPSDVQGITSLEVPDEIYVNEAFVVSGIVNSGSTLTLSLGDGNTSDSLVLSSGENRFQLTYTPKLAGKQLVNLHLKTPQGTLIEAVPFIAKQQPVLDVLILQASPGFELRELKNFMAQKGHRICARSQVSREQFRYEFINRQSTSLNRLSDLTLKPFDLIITNSETLEQLDKSSLATIRNANSEGLGVLIVVNSDLSALSESKRMLSMDFEENKYDTAHVTLPDRSTITIAVQPLSVSNTSEVTILKQSGSKALSGYHFNQLGRAGFTLFHETYRLQLEGKNAEYAFLWNDLIKKVSRFEKVSTSLDLQNSFPLYSGDPLAVNLLTTQSPIALTHNHTTIPLLENSSVDNLYTGSFWAGASGWHTLSASDSTSYSFFVSDTSAWKSLRIANQQRELMARAEMAASDTNSVILEHPIPAWTFYLSFLFAIGFLWLAPKL